MSARAAVTNRSSTATRSNTRTRTSTGPQATTRPKLKVLNQEAIRQRARRRNALVVLFIVVLIGFFGVALVHAQLVSGQQDLDSVRSRIAEAEAHRAKIERLVDEASSPDVIFQKATLELGMVRAHQPVYLEAVSPVRDLPTVATFVPQGAPEHLDVAAGVSSSAPGISSGISAQADVVLGTEATEPQVVAIAQSEPTTVATAPPSTEVVVSTGGAFGGVAVAASGLQGASTTSQQATSSFAGSTAVSGGQGSG